MKMAKDVCKSLPRSPNDESPTNGLFSSRNRCCFHFPCFHSRDSAPSSASRIGEVERSWWSAPFNAITKLREWSEIVAGPKWKTFIRRFNRNKGNKHANFQYDPLSYALNFDEGSAKICPDDEEHGFYPDFTSRFVSGSLASKSPTDLGNHVAAAS